MSDPSPPPESASPDLFGQEPGWVEGRVQRVLWAKDDGSWAVLKVETATGPLVVVGALGHVADLAGEGGEAPFASFEGSYERHPNHGHQFKAHTVLLGAPRTDAGLRMYLASSGVRGIGPTMAARIVDWFGQQTTSILETEPERLAEVPGIGKRRAGAVAEAWAADAGGRALTILLRGLGLSGRLVVRVQHRYGDEAYKVVTTEPYRLAEEVRGIGFGIADELARAQGMPADHPDRIAAAVRHVVARGSDDGHTWLPVEHLARGLERLRVPTPDLGPVLDRLVADGRLVEVSVDPRGVAIPSLAGVEDRLGTRIVDRAAVPPAAVDGLDAAIAASSAHVGIVLDDTQEAAVKQAATSRITIVTGGPGTGKTTLVRVLLSVVEARGETWSLASPTGRAAKRLAEATGREASTLHRLLGFQPGTGGFQHDEREPLASDGLVIDEVSMVDVHLMEAVLRALPTDRPFHLVLVGDAQQLPSVGPGRVLGDLVESGVVPVVRLQTVHRQAARSGIVQAAAVVQQGEVPVSGERTDYDDLFLVRRSRPEDVVRTVLEVVTERLPAKGFDPRTDVQVLVPTRKGAVGMGALNAALHDALVGEAPTIRMGSRVLAVGDRVVCTRNRYDHGVFNGDLGEVVEVGKSEARVRFDVGVLPWPRDELDDLDLAWAMTVHKSQGSEYPAVVLVLHRAHGILLRRNLVYTAVTRAKRFFVGVGEDEAWRRAVRRDTAEDRHTRLVDLLRAARDGG